MYYSMGEKFHHYTAVQLCHQNISNDTMTEGHAVQKNAVYICSQHYKLTYSNICAWWIGLHQISTPLWQIRNPAIFRHPAKSGSGQISSRIWQMPVCSWNTFSQLQTTLTWLTCQVVYLQFNLVLLDDKNTKPTAVPQILSKTGKQWRN